MLKIETEFRRMAAWANASEPHARSISHMSSPTNPARMSYSRILSFYQVQTHSQQGGENIAVSASTRLVQQAARAPRAGQMDKIGRFHGLANCMPRQWLVASVMVACVLGSLGSSYMHFTEEELFDALHATERQARQESGVHVRAVSVQSLV